MPTVAARRGGQQRPDRAPGDRVEIFHRDAGVRGAAAARPRNASAIAGEIARARRPQEGGPCGTWRSVQWSSGRQPRQERSRGRGASNEVAVAPVARDPHGDLGTSGDSGLPTRNRLPSASRGAAEELPGQLAVDDRRSWGSPSRLGRRGSKSRPARSGGCPRSRSSGQRPRRRCSLRSGPWLGGGGGSPFPAAIGPSSLLGVDQRHGGLTDETARTAGTRSSRRVSSSKNCRASRGGAVVVEQARGWILPETRVSMAGAGIEPPRACAGCAASSPPGATTTTISTAS